MNDTVKFRRTTATAHHTNYMDDLTDGVLLEILIRLPCKSANQCKSVSKRWLALISSTYFLSRFVYHHHNHWSSSSLPFALLFHYSNYPDKRTLVCSNDYPNKNIQVYSKDRVFKSRGFSLSFLPCFQRDAKLPIWVVGSFKDLLLCCATPFNQTVYYICNPFTMQWVVLPPTPQCHRRVRVGFMCDQYFGDDQNKEILCTKINTQYRYTVVRLREFEVGGVPFNKNNIEIFSSETGKWSESVMSCSPFPILHFTYGPQHAIPYNGMLHWWSERNGILVFDPYNTDDTSSFRFIDHPTDFENGLRLFCLGVCQGHLRMGLLTMTNIGIVWELNDYDTCEWRLVHKVNFKEIVSENYLIKKNINHMELLAFDPNDGDILYFHLVGKLLLYNMRRKTLEVACKISMEKGVIWDRNVFLPSLQLWPTPVPTLSQNAVPS